MFRAAGYNIDAEVLWLPCCPSALLSHFTRAMLRSWLWLEEWHLTPMSFGTQVDDVDPRFFPAMEVLKREQRRVEREEYEKAREGGK